MIPLLLAVLATPAFAQAAAGKHDDPALPRTPADWKVEVVARFPAVRHPSAVAGAPDGRVFVGEDPQDMEGPVDARIGRVLCVHPGGKVTVFAEKLGPVFGLHYLEGKLYVHHPPNLTAYRDDDGVGRDARDVIACTHPEPSRMNRYNTHIPANFRLGMDGFFYLSVGDKGLFGASRMKGGGVFRFRPDGTQPEVVSTGTRNHTDLAIDAEDEVFAFDNDDNLKWGARLYHHVEGGYYGYPWDQGRPWTLGAMFDGRGIPAGSVAFDEDGLPDAYRGNLFFCEWGRSQLLRVRVAREGATYRILSREALATRGREEFRPVGIAVSPDGTGFLVADWNTAARLTKGDAGRILRFVYAGPHRPEPRPAWYPAAASGRPFEATDEDLVKALAHPARCVRRTAQRRLTDRRAAGSLEALLSDASAPPRARAHALWALDAIDGAASARRAVLDAARGADPLVRRQAVRQLGVRRAAEAAGTFAGLLSHEDAVTRFHAATALGRLGTPRAAEPLCALLDDRDDFVRHAAFTALHRIGAWDALATVLRSGGARAREAAISAFRDAYDERAVAALAAVPEGARAAAVATLGDLVRRDPEWDGTWWGTRPVVAPRPRRTVEWAGTAPAREAILRALDDSSPAVRRAAVEALRVAAETSAAPALRERFAREPETAIRRELLETLAAFKDPSAAALAAALLEAADPVPDLVALAVRRVDESGPIVRLIGRTTDARLLGPALDALGPRGGPAAAAAVAPHLGHADGTVRARAARALGRLREGREGLLKAIEDREPEVRRAAATALGEARSREAVPALLKLHQDAEARLEAAFALAATSDLRALEVYLDGLAGKNPDLRAACRRAIGEIGAAALPEIEKRVDRLPPLAVGELQRVFASVPAARGSPLLARPVKGPEPSEFIAFALANPGDAAAGRRLFTDAAACSRCHSVRGRGGDLGPDLTMVGGIYDRLYLAESVVFPSKIAPGTFRLVLVRTRDGNVHSGMVRKETPEELVLVDPEGKTTPIRKSAIEARRLGDLSLMPDGLVAGLTPQEFSDLISYLESLKAEE